MPYGLYPRLLYLTLSHHRHIHADCGQDNAAFAFPQRHTAPAEVISIDDALGAA